MKSITYDEFLKLNPCWLTDGRAEKLARISKRKKEWTAVDILKLEDVDAKDKLWAVFEAGLIPDPIAHEWSCRCAERALKAAGIEEEPGNASWNAIHTKRRWLRGEATDEELAAARHAAWEAARHVAWEAAWAVARDAAGDAARDAERKWQVEELVKMLKEAGE